MAINQTDLDALDKAIASGALEVRLEGRSVKYRDVSQLIEARKHLASLLATQQGGRRGSTYHFTFQTGRGF